ncbi:topoisomerase DNA-binding C4 zinc finger domain-containing protein [Clostridium tyrobutyricum]|nr:topoisomerase DNA-binding C4 zinc finger domain-containing protein [Clostridium tyrobutyricum]MBV4444846.1 topoisomerase DNA-binding C4 zinc finger domain-containing protein [Clostridium tyrobutyricum]
MIKTKGRFGEFYGCTNFLHCKQTLQVEKS